MLCKTIAADGSDFYIDGNIVTVIAASGIGCSGKFDTDSLELSLDKPLAPGNYTLKVKQGTDGNTVLDICENGLPTSETLPLTVLPRVPTPMDSLATVSCAPKELKLVFSKDILCSSIAPDGSDFIISGPYPVGIIAAAGNCQGTGTKEITLTLAQPMSELGDFLVSLKTGNDGNTIFNECNEETPAGSTLPFSVKDTVNAAFNYSIQFGCTQDIVQYTHPGGNQINSWNWDLDDRFSSSQQDPQASYSLFTDKLIQLVVSNGFCSDTASQTIVLDNFIKADFEVAADNCPLDSILFTSTAVGKIKTHTWSFGDGQAAYDQSPTHVYARTSSTRDFVIRYTVTDSIGCSSSIEKNTRIYVSCLIDIPNAFSPNADGRNDVLYPLNAVKAEQLTFTVYNRWGQVVFKTNNWKKGWDGRFNAVLQESGMYTWTLTFTDRDSKKQFFKKGNTMLIR